MASHHRTMIVVGVLVAICVPLAMRLAMKVAPWHEEPARSGFVATGTPTSAIEAGYDVLMAPNPDCLGASTSSCIDTTNTEFCPKFYACESDIEDVGWDRMTPDQRAQYRADYLAWLRSLAECPPGYDSSKPEFASLQCVRRAQPDVGPLALPAGSQPRPFPGTSNNDP